MKKALPILVILILAIGAVMIAASRNRRQDMAAQDKNGQTANNTSSADAPILWYGMMAHPYIAEVQKGAEAYARDGNVKINIVVGQEWTQDNETKNIESYSTRGYKGFTMFPGDPTGANTIFKELRDHGQYVVVFGCEPSLPTPASFTVATNIRSAAMEACEALIHTMGDKGNILNVLETVTDPNTPVRDQAVKDVVAKHPNVQILQTISDMTAQDVATTKIESAMTANGDKIDGIIATGFTPTVAAAHILKKWHADPSHKRIHFIGIDTDPDVISAIRDGSIDGTVAQNPFAHGYVSCAILKLITVDGYKPVQPYQFIDAGDMVVTKDNLDTYPSDIQKKTDAIMKDLTVKYLTK